MKEFFNKTKNKIIKGKIKSGWQKNLVDAFIEIDSLKSEKPEGILSGYKEIQLSKDGRKIAELYKKLKEEGCEEHAKILNLGISHDGVPIWSRGAKEDTLNSLYKKVNGNLFLEKIYIRDKYYREAQRLELNKKKSLYYKFFMKDKVEREIKEMKEKEKEISENIISDKKNFNRLVGNRFLEEAIKEGLGEMLKGYLKENPLKIENNERLLEKLPKNRKEIIGMEERYMNEILNSEKENKFDLLAQRKNNVYKDFVNYKRI